MVCDYTHVFTFYTGVLMAMTGCASSSNPGPPQALNDFSSTYTRKVGAALKSRISSTTGELVIADAADRDRIINQLIVLIDYNYYRIETNLEKSKAFTDFAGSIISTGLGTAGAIAGGGTAQIMSALIAAIEATKTSVDKDLLRGQTITAIISKMRELRATKVVAIRQAMKKGLEQYSMSQALIDLLEYYNAGTFFGAVQSITEQAAAGTAKAKAALDEKIRKLPSIDDLLRK
jgi:hypothetical protein